MDIDRAQQALRVKFWGTRGSIPKPGADTLRYGGNTSCVEVRSAGGTLLVLDCGTGAHALGRALMAAGSGPVNGHLLFTHTHWDHIQGFPFFAPLFAPGNQWDIYAPKGLSRQIKDTLAGQMEYTYFPVTLDQLGATIRYHELVEGSFSIGDVVVTAHYLNHPSLALGYRVECDGAVVVYSTDHEPHARPGASAAEESASRAPLAEHPAERAHVEFLAGADLVIHDAQYIAADFPAKLGWGHSPAEYVVDVAAAAGVRRVALFHHDPTRDDAGVDTIVADCRQRLRAAGADVEVFAAAEGQCVELPARAPRAARGGASEARGGTLQALPQTTVVAACADSETTASLSEAVRADGLRVVAASDGAAVLDLVRRDAVALVLVDRDLPGLDGIDVCRALRSAAEPASRDVPVVLVCEHDHAPDIALGTAAGVTDWLVKPFSREYARTKIGAWLLRTRARWVSGPVPPTEAGRLEALHRLRVLDTPAEERFDRLTRLAQRIFDVPIALVSLVDADRQWFKSCQGLPVRETPRELAFCAHAILQEDTTVVPDALLDERFADNPLVTGEPHIRFYAGQPLCAADGSRVGTLCIIDRRPRQLDEADRRALRDLAAVAEGELTGRPVARPRTIRKR